MIQFLCAQNHDLFLKNCVPSPACKCGAPRETRCHFLLFCPRFAALRTELLTSLVQVVSYAWANSTLWNKVNWLLNGFPGLDYKSNAIIFIGLGLPVKIFSRALSKQHCICFLHVVVSCCFCCFSSFRWLDVEFTPKQELSHAWVTVVLVLPPRNFQVKADPQMCGCGLQCYSHGTLKQEWPMDKQSQYAFRVIPIALWSERCNFVVLMSLPVSFRISTSWYDL